MSRDIPGYNQANNITYLMFSPGNQKSLVGRSPWLVDGWMDGSRIMMSATQTEYRNMMLAFARPTLFRTLFFLNFIKSTEK